MSFCLKNTMLSLHILLLYVLNVFIRFVFAVNMHLMYFACDFKIMYH